MENLELFDSEESTLYFERRALRYGYGRVSGIDEAGRGPLAGPVVAAAVILSDSFELPGLTDSKKLSERQRERFYPLIRLQARSVGVGVASAAEIDQMNILQATLLAMRRAVIRLSIAPDYLLIDGITPLPLEIPQLCLKKGDSRSLSIAAASVVAKVVRDRIMCSFSRQMPEYRFEKHKGYGTKQHREAIEKFGPSWLHRKSFAGVKEYVRGGMTETRLALGEWGENLAVDYLRQQGLKILERNFTTPVGEIDIVARNRTNLVFVEVKTRRSVMFGSPQEAVGKRKQRQIIRAAHWYLQNHSAGKLQPRFDVIAILCQSGEDVKITHIPDAFTLPG